MSFVFNILLSALLDSSAQDKKLMVHEYSGETMHYKLKYGFFNIGVASISCFEDPEGCGYIIRAVMQSTGLLKVFKNMNYRFECCMDQNTGLPNSATIDLKDRNNNSYNEVLFDRNSRSDSTIIISQTTGEHVVQKNIHDLLTGYYHFRKDLFGESVINGNTVVIQTFLADMLWDLKMTYTGGETIKTMYGQVTCLRFTSSTVDGKYFPSEDAMTVWFTKDDIPVPVKVRLNLKLGSVKGELDRYQMPINN